MADLLSIAPLRDVMQQYLRGHWKSVGNDYSVTELIKPPQVVQLEHRYKEELNRLPITEKDVRGALKAFVGTAVHEKLQKVLWGFTSAHPNNNYLVERKLWDKILDRKIVGKFDCWLNSALYDWKTTSVWKRIFSQFDEFEQQLNIYAYLLKTSGVPVNILYVILWYTDWEKYKAGVQKDYPRDPVEQLMVDKLWTLAEQKDYIEMCVRKQIVNEDRLDEDLDPCLESEMWERPSKFAVTYPNAKKAVRVLDTMDEADEYIAESPNKDKDKWFVEHRPGERIRCEQFCRVNGYCCQYREYCNANKT